MGLPPRDRAALRKALHAARKGESGAARALYERLRGLSAKEVLAALRDAGEQYADDLAKELAEQIGTAHRIGARAVTDSALRTLRRDRLPGGLAERAEKWLRRRIADQTFRVSPLTGARTAMVSQEGTVWLSRALHGANSGKVIEGLRGAIVEAVKNGETASSLAQRMRDDIGHRVAITAEGPAAARIAPEVVQAEKAALRAIRASGDPRIGPDLARMRREFARYRDGLSAGGSKAAARALISDLERAITRGSAKAVDDAVKWFAWNKAADHEKLIAKTETARAYTQAYIEGSRAVPWVKGWIFVASEDACEEVCAPLDGTFIPRDANGPFPISDTHPGCECALEEAIDEDMQPTREEWEATLAAAAV